MTLAEKRSHVAAAKNTRDHDCHAKGCGAKVKPALFMCARHWRLVPTRLKRAVWVHYAIGQENGEARVSAEYLRVTDEAIEAVAASEAA